jgi:hypothetical protein
MWRDPGQRHPSTTEVSASPGAAKETTRLVLPEQGGVFGLDILFFSRGYGRSQGTGKSPEPVFRLKRRKEQCLGTVVADAETSRHVRVAKDPDARYWSDQHS